MLRLSPFTIFAPHVDDQGQGIAHTYWTRHPRTSNAITILDLHIALGWTQGKYHWIASSHPEDEY